LPKTTAESTWQTSRMRADIGLGADKIGSRNLRTALPFIANFVEKTINAGSKGSDGVSLPKGILLSCESGTNLAIGAALAILCLFFKDDGTMMDEGRRVSLIDKTFIRSRLGWISTSMPDANPSRATLQSVNSFLMDWR